MRVIAIFFIYTILLCWPWPGSADAATAFPEDNHAAVILAYHRIDEDSFPHSSIPADQFAAHVAEMIDGGYNIIPLPRLVEALKKQETLPPRTIAITFEGGFKSALRNAIPLLLKKKLPFTVFYASDYADSGTDAYMNWNDLRELSRHDNVSLGLLPSSYSHPDPANETEIRRQVNKARARHRDVFGQEARFFSYPYGEYTQQYKTIIAASGFDAAFGLQSGAASPASDLYALPRFVMTEGYGDLDRFRTVAGTLPFPVHDIEPSASLLESSAPAIGFSVPDSLKTSLKSLSCFASGQQDPEVEILGSRIELRLKEPVEDRIRVNCTLPGPNDPDNDTPTWRWFGLLLVWPGAAGEDGQ